MVAVRVDHLNRGAAAGVPAYGRSALRLVTGEELLPVLRPSAAGGSRPAVAYLPGRQARSASGTALRPSRPSPEVYRRRRLIAAGLLLLVVAGALVIVQAAIGRVGGGPLTTTDAGGGASASARVWVVQPGQTLWAIASALDPTGDARPIVARLAAETGSSTVYPGERISLP